MTLPTIGAIIGFLTAFLWFILTYNRLIRDRNLTREAWSGIDVQLKRRHELIPQIVTTVKAYATHEQTLLEGVTQLRNTAAASTSVQDVGRTEQSLSQSLK